jgi:hypothetical protein
MNPFHLVLTLRSRFASFRIFLTFRDLLDVNRPNRFATSFSWKIEDREKKNSMENATRWELGGTTRAHTLATWWGPFYPSCVLSTYSWSPRICINLKNVSHLQKTWNNAFEAIHFIFRRACQTSSPVSNLKNIYRGGLLF